MITAPHRGRFVNYQLSLAHLPIAPKPGETICDPACGTGGFFLAAHDYIVRHYPNLTKDEKRSRKMGTGYFDWGGIKVSGTISNPLALISSRGIG